MIAVGIQMVGNDPGLFATIDAAAARTFPGSTVLCHETLDDAVRSERGSGLRLLVLPESLGSLLSTCLEAEDDAGLPRWGIIHFGKAADLDGVLALGAAERRPEVVDGALRSAVVHQRLRRENARLTGDLMTIAQRISHDLKTPLGAILSANEAMADLLPQRTDSGEELMASVCDSVRELNELIGRVGALIRASVAPTVTESVRMEEVVGGALQRLERRILEKGIRIAQAPSWPEVRGVPSWLETVWYNLVLNAAQQSEVGAVVELGWDRIREGGRFWVSDTGRGVPAQRRSTLLQPFHALHRSRTGQGLGLPIVERLVALHGGSVGYRPRDGGGSIFHFTLPG